ncbi:glycosyltransferase [Salinimicrobium oceani]|uniref:Colanic acid biosynthesis glycosyltransferase WcaL n=1 Tax=Salinimicrobium oceani TaxID=2722702 RepID=A0ABX1D1B3_9FLAO|nr:glycosyltransferase [Salinimicrobium oceani]NJW53444.1 colanic acid biosynthesis glycosyltransferase WcaL [Salinimicrobium oceani]
MNHKLNILFIVSSFPTISETFIINQIIFLIDSGHTIRILSLKKNNIDSHPKILEYKLMEKTEFINVFPFKKRLMHFLCLFFKANLKTKLLYLQTLKINRYKKQALNLRIFHKMLAVSKFKLEFDIIHAHYGFNSEIYFELKDFPWLRNSKLLTTFHGHDMKTSFLKKNKIRYKRLFDENIMITTNNEYGISLLQKIRRDYKNIQLLPVSLDTNYFHPSSGAKLNQQNTVILFCGRFIPVKAPTAVIEIANILVNYEKILNITFVLIGSGPEEPKVRELIKAYQLESYIKLKGSLNQDDVISEMRNAKIFVLPGITDEKGRAETQGLVIQEAQAIGLPVIVSNAGGMRYGLIDLETGFILPEGDIDAFARIIKKLIDDPALALQLGKKGRNYVVKNFDSKVLGFRLLKIYNELLSK